MRKITLIALLGCAIACSTGVQADGSTKAAKPQQSAKKVRAQYILAMSEDDSVCKPVLAEYNKNIELDLFPKSRPYPYPWPVPEALAIKWLPKEWSDLTEDERVASKGYTVAEADLAGDGRPETVVRLADWLRSDYRFTWLEIFPQGMQLSKNFKEYEKNFRLGRAANISAGGYHFPKLKGSIEPTALNDFDVIQFKGRYFVTGKTVIMDGIVEDHKVPKWRVISRVRFSKPTTPPESDLDWTLDSVCYFLLNTTKY